MHTHILIFILILSFSCTNVPKKKPKTVKAGIATVPQKDVSEDKNLITLWLSHYQVPCVGEGDPILCYLAQEGKEIVEEKWEYFYDAIEGFEDYEWGYNYQLKVKKTKVKEPPADASTLQYELVELVHKEKVSNGTTFDILLNMGAPLSPFIATNTDKDGIYLLNSIKVDLAENKLQRQLIDLIKQQNTFIGTFQHSSKAQTLILTDLKEN